MSFDFSTLVTDRSQADLDTLRALLSVPLADWTAGQLAEFNQAVSKGAYNYTDLNRVTACMEYLNEVLTAAGYATGYCPIILHQENPQPVLPEGYTELEYIESTGTQYIVTNLLVNQKTKMEAKFKSLANGQWIAGAVESNNQNGYGVYTNGTVFGTASWIQPMNLYDGFWHEILFENGILFSDGKEELSGTSIPFSTLRPQYIFAVNYGGNVDGRVSPGIAISYLKYSENGVPVCSLVPCKNPLGKVGFYDIVGNTFYLNSGSGDFIAGPEIPAPDPAPILNPTTWYEKDVPTLTQMQRYMGNVSALRGVLELPEDTAAVPEDMAGLTLEEANAIEDILESIEGWIQGMMQAWFYSGEIYAG